tara:strand:+ start:26214 stop:26888 length:675 start_codon:yes stop_codon:yes gene_type:complete
VENFNLKPIGFFRCKEKYPQELPRQASEASGNLAKVEVKDLFPLRQALEDLEQCPKIWLIYLFHRNRGWKPKVYPPRGSDKKIGLFATRAPYRPNPIGLSCVDLVRVEKNTILVKNYDLLDGTPILDIKPYISYADSFQNVAPSWKKKEESYEITFSEQALEKMQYLDEKLQMNIHALLVEQLEVQPFYQKRKRIMEVGQNKYVYAFRTWRFDLHGALTWKFRD